MSENKVSTGFLDAMLSGGLDNYQEGSGVPDPDNSAQAAPVTENAEQIQDHTNGNTPGNVAPENSNTNIPNGGTIPEGDADAYISKITNGAFSSLSGLTDFASKRDHFTGLESQVLDYQNEINALKGNSPKFANEYIQKLNELHLAGAPDSQIEAYIAINKVGDLDSLEPKEVIKYSLMLKDKLTQKEAENYLEALYSLDEELHDESTVEFNKIKLKRDAANELSFLKDHKAEVTKMPVVDQVDEAEIQRKAEIQRESYLVQARPAISQIVNSFDVFRGVSLNGKVGDEAILSDLPVSDETKKSIGSIIENYAVSNNIQLNEDGIEHLRDFTKRVVAMQNYENWIADSYAKGQQSMAERYHNPSSIKRPEDRNAPAVKDFKATLDWVAKNG